MRPQRATGIALVVLGAASLGAFIVLLFRTDRLHPGMGLMFSAIAFFVAALLVVLGVVVGWGPTDEERRMARQTAARQRR